MPGVIGGAMTVLTCSQCGRDLKPHCRPGAACDWLRCTNRTCDARYFDVHRGILLHEDGQVERLGAAS